MRTPVALVARLLLLTVSAAAACGGPARPWDRTPDASAPGVETPGVDTLRAAAEAVRPLHRTLGPPAVGEWLASYAEPRQTFDDYLASSPVTARAERHVLYIQPLGPLSESQRRIVDLTAELLGDFFGLPVRTLDPLPLDVVPVSARRVRTDLDTTQIAAGTVTQKVLRPRLPADAAALIALTASDLWPDEASTWNFVFGQASTVDRVGVWSLYRLGDPDAGPTSFRTCLLRTAKIAAHETGHMFSLPHCSMYECCMGGSMTLEETDHAPLEVCPECMAKLCWATGADPHDRFRRLARFCGERGFDRERRIYERSLAALDGPAWRDDPVVRAEAGALDDARARIEARTAERQEGFRARDAARYLAPASSDDFDATLANGVVVGLDAFRSALASAWKRLRPSATDRVDVSDVRLDDGEATVVVRLQGPAVVTAFRETWRTSRGAWRLVRVQELVPGGAAAP